MFTNATNLAPVVLIGLLAFVVDVLMGIGIANYRRASNKKSKQYKLKQYKLKQF
jgi:hypothetical protein